MKNKASIEPVNLVMGFVALIGAVLILINQTNYGLILIIIATIIEDMQRLLK